MPGRRERITFNRRTAKRIATVVTNAERGNRNMSPIRFRTAAGDDGGDQIRIGQVSNGWEKMATKSVTVIENDGTTTSSETFIATNLFASIVATEPIRVACAQVNGAWFLIAAECP